MSVKVREGSLEECIAVIGEISEFSRAETVESLAERLDGRKSLILIAEENEELLGVKIGYELNASQFYSWLGGVLPRARGKGVAQVLLVAQEQWGRASGYKEIKVKTRNQFPSMIRLLSRNNYLIEKFEKKENNLESRIHFIKTLENK
ncbi:GNAT family N-acetyltransferase [Vibrio sp. HN007]|uniref:GNAT family N-acetyltransferase n=1 Tax=Vibrio iocasae TaxID=3098914 RepID=UPI0035D4E8FE